LIDVKIFKTADGKEPFTKWLEGIKSIKAKSRVLVAMQRMQTGLISDTKPVGEGVQEIRIHIESGYRIYFGYDGTELIILLAGSTKKNQSREIEKAKDYWKQYKAGKTTIERNFANEKRQ
jgi:putative addiction module killer protein